MEGDNNAQDGIIDDSEVEVGYVKAFSDPQYARASMVGCAMAMF